jgi:hypothetical protein
MSRISSCCIAQPVHQMLLHFPCAASVNLHPNPNSVQHHPSAQLDSVKQSVKPARWHHPARSQYQRHQPTAHIPPVCINWQIEWFPAPSPFATSATRTTRTKRTARAEHSVPTGHLKPWRGPPLTLPIGAAHCSSTLHSHRQSCQTVTACGSVSSHSRVPNSAQPYECCLLRG